MAIEAVIFDFDGVITDSEILHLLAFNKVLTQFDTKIARTDYYKKYLGSTDIEVFETLAKEDKLKPGEKRLEELVQQKSKIFKEISTVEGKIIESLPNATFRVELENGHQILAYVSGKMRMNFIKILAGDMVKVQLSPYDLTRGRIIYRK